MTRLYLCVYLDQEEAWLTLNESERGRLITAAIAYKKRGEVPELRGNERFQWPIIKAQIDRDSESYADKIEKCSNAGRISAAMRQRTLTDVNERQQTLTGVNNKRKENRIKENKTEENKTEHNMKSAGGRSGKRPDAFAEFAGEDDSLLGALKDFEAMRNRIKKPLTDGAKDRIVTRLSKDFPRDQWVGILNQSTDRCWQDLYPLKTMPGTHGANGGRPTADTVPISELVDRI